MPESKREKSKNKRRAPVTAVPRKVITTETIDRLRPKYEKRTIKLINKKRFRTGKDPEFFGSLKI